MSDAVAIYHTVAKILDRHRRCFKPGSGAFCSCMEWWCPDQTDDLEWHEHAAQKVAYALEKLA